MRNLTAWLLLGLVAISLLSHYSVRAAGQAETDEDPDDGAKEAGSEEEEEEEDLLLIPHPEVSVTYVFPDAPTRKLKLDGNEVSILLGFNNKAPEAFNITGIGAHLQNPFDLSYYVQNFTARRVVGAAVGPGQQASVEYRFKPDPSLEPIEYWMTAWVIYNNSNDRVYMHTFYNGTVELIEDNPGFSLKQFIQYVLVLGMLGLGGFFAFKLTSGGSKPAKRVERGTRETSDDYQIYKPAAQSKAVRRSRPSSTPKKPTKKGAASGGESADEQ